MALTTVVNDRNIYGNKRVTFATVTFDSSYATGGESLTPADLGLSTVTRAVGAVKVPAGSVTSLVYDTTNSKFKANTVTAEVANAVDLSALVVEVTAHGY